jgi:hypothetical protein
MKANTLEDIGRLAIAAQLASEAWKGRARCEIETPPEPEVGHYGDPPCYMMTKEERERAGGMCEPCKASAILWANRRRARNTLCAAIIRRLKREARPEAKP